MRRNLPRYLLVVAVSLFFWALHSLEDRACGGVPVTSDWQDLKAFAERWLQPADAQLPADADGSQVVDLRDFAYWARYWRQPNPYSVGFNPDSTAQGPYVVTYNPYAGVDWQQWPRALAQHHDHMTRGSAGIPDRVLSWDKIRAYDQAGYNVIVPLDYAGKRSANFACTYRLWPVHQYLPGFDSDEQVLASMANI